MDPDVMHAIVELHHALAELRAKLRDAEATIARLTEEVDSLRARPSDAITPWDLFVGALATNSAMSTWEVCLAADELMAEREKRRRRRVGHSYEDKRKKKQ